MPTRNTRPSPGELDADWAIVVALQDVPDYAPTNVVYNLAALRELVQRLDYAEETELRARRALEVAREQVTAAAMQLHDTMFEVKVQVRAQFGSDSPVVHAVGLKQRSERKRQTCRTPPAQ